MPLVMARAKRSYLGNIMQVDYLHDLRIGTNTQNYAFGGFRFLWVASGGRQGN